MRHRAVLREALRYIKPRTPERDRLLGMAHKTLGVVSEEAVKHGAKAMLAGSITRGTWLPFKMEFEVFVLFPPTVSKKELAELIVEIGKASIQRLGGSYVVAYAEHPYVRGFVGGMEIDIVPCYEVASPKEMRSAVDRTPFHVRYLDENLPKDSVDEVRLLKHFLAVHGLYGADAKTQGFSGYLCELLILHYGEFLKALEAAIEWQPGQVVDIEGYYSRDDWPRLRKKFREPLIVIDPIDSNRNVASAVSPMSFFRFKELASNFLARPSMDFFYQKRPIGLGVKELRQILAQRKTELLLIRFKPPRVVPDILWPQLRRFAKRLKGILEEVRYEFKVFGWDVWTDDRELAVVLLEMEIASLPSVQKRIGPPIFDAENSRRFLQKYKKEAVVGPYIEDNRWCVEIRRRWCNAKEKLMDSLSKGLEVLRAKGIPGHIAKQLVEGFEVLDGKGIERLARRERGIAVFLKSYFSKGL